MSAYCGEPGGGGEEDCGLNYRLHSRKVPKITTWICDEKPEVDARHYHLPAQVLPAQQEVLTH
jgi:hypothetical protein